MSSSDEEDEDQAPDVDLSKPLEDSSKDVKLLKAKSVGAAAASASPKQTTQTAKSKKEVYNMDSIKKEVEGMEKRKVSK